MRREWKQVTVVGLVAFTAPCLGCAATARFLLHWSVDASWLTGIAPSTTSVAMAYAVMLEFGLAPTECGNVVLAACFVNDLATVLVLGLKFSPFGHRTLIFAAASAAAFVVLPWLVPRFFARYGGRPSELEAKLLLARSGLGALALFGLSHGGVDQRQYSYLIGAVIGSAIVPTLVANAFFLPRHLLPQDTDASTGTLAADRHR